MTRFLAIAEETIITVKVICDMDNEV